jgi:hypothetical protein
VLALTGSLAPEMEAKVAAAIRSRYGGGPDWMRTLRDTVRLPADLDQRIQSLWQTQPPGTDALAFALAVSDANFATMLDAGDEV